LNSIWKSRSAIRAFSFGVLFLLSFCFEPLSAQSRINLEKKRNNLQNEIKEAGKLLEKTTKAQKNEYQRFQVLQSQVQKREELITTIRKEIRLVNNQIESNTKESKKLESEIEKLYKEYAAVLQKVYRISLTSDKLLLMLSSKDMNQALQRWTYVNQIKKVRKEQSLILNEKRSALEEKRNQLEIYRKEKQALLQNEEKQKELIATELEEKNTLLNNLKKDESRIKKEIKDKEIAKEQLNAEIQKIIAAEIEKQRKEAEAKAAAAAKAKKEAELAKAAEEKKKAEEKSKSQPSEPTAKVETKPAEKSKPAPANPVNLPETPEIKILSDGFASNKGKLPWPVQKGTISRKFGTQPHPIVQSLTITNNGINIRTEKGASVRSVFKGEVVGKKYVPGYHYLVMVQHGNYYTIYSNLEEVMVKEGQKINTGEIIGKVFGEDDDVFSEIHFEIWQDKKLQDPTLWLKL
jgi:murein hydrolase activator